VAAFEALARDGKDAELKEWANKTLPALREHLKMARDLSKGSGSGAPERQPER
jgi:putative membrane protein